MTSDVPAEPVDDAGRPPRLPSRATGRPDDGSAQPEPPGEPFADDAPRRLDAVVGDCAVYEDGHRRPGRVPLDRAGDVARSTSGFVWIGLQQPTAAEMAAVAGQFGLPPLKVKDAVKAHQRPKLEVYDDVVVVVLKPVRYVDHEEVVDVSEIAFFLGPNFLVTARHGESDVLGRVRAELDRGDAKLIAHGPTYVLYRAADLVVDGYEEAITAITEDVDEIESQVFGSTGDDDHSERIYKLKRELAEFRRAVLPLATPLQRLADGSVPGVAEAAAPYFRNLHDHVMRVADAIEGHDRLLSDVLQADLARLAARQSRIALQQNEIAVRHSEIAVRQNEDVRKITAWVAIIAVPTAVTGFFGQNVPYPGFGARSGFVASSVIIVLIAIALYALFRRLKWL